MTDHLERMWAGWRAAYMKTTETGKAEHFTGDHDPVDRCVMCEVVVGESANTTRLVHEAELVVAVMNAYPYNNGHVLVVPRRHVDTVDQLDLDERTAFWDLVTQASTAIRDSYGCDGINMGVNEGRAAGAGLPDHLHAHVLPRWFGDTSFTTTVAGTRVIPEDLADSAARIRSCWPGR
ncbi:MAG: HIT domain-containing protein [Actinomycetia bacterium]|nr:HIT domain-containing protein [Actinomycetes bacterium]MCP4958372.1 HIT domain-containing protein [Actinomycetes bacterium]